MKIKEHPVWYWLIPKSWRVCIYFADNEQTCDAIMKRHVHPIWYYLITGKLWFYWDKATGKGQYRIGQYTGQYLWALRLRIWLNNASNDMRCKFHNFKVDCQCYMDGHTWEVIDWSDEKAINPPFQAKSITLSCTNCGREIDVPVSQNYCAVCGQTKPVEQTRIIEYGTEDKHDERVVCDACVEAQKES